MHLYHMLVNPKQLTSESASPIWHLSEIGAMCMNQRNIGKMAQQVIMSATNPYNLNSTLEFTRLKGEPNSNSHL